MFLNRKMSSFLSLLIVFLFAFCLGSIIIVKSKNLKKLEEPFRFSEIEEFFIDADISH